MTPFAKRIVYACCVTWGMLMLVHGRPAINVVNRGSNPVLIIEHDGTNTIIMPGMGARVRPRFILDPSRTYQL